MGGRIGYSLATGVVIALVCFLGLTALLLAVVPLVAILPILLYIGLVIGAQAFQAVPAKHAPAVVLAIIPNIAAWGQTQIDGALNAAGTSAAQLGMAKLGATGVVYHGMELLGGGAVLAGLMLGAIAAFIIDREFMKAAAYSLRCGRAVVLRLHPRCAARMDGLAAGGAGLCLAGRDLLECRDERTASEGRRQNGIGAGLKQRSGGVGIAFQQAENADCARTVPHG